MRTPKSLIIKHTRPSGDTCITCAWGSGAPPLKTIIKMVMTTRKDSTDKSKGQEWLLISGKPEELDTLQWCTKAWATDITTHRRATSHLPPAGIRGGAQKIFSRFLTGPPHLSLFALCQLGESKRHPGPFFWATAQRRCVIGEKTQTSGSPSLLFCFLIAAFYHPAHIHTYKTTTA